VGAVRNNLFEVTAHHVCTEMSDTSRTSSQSELDTALVHEFMHSLDSFSVASIVASEPGINGISLLEDDVRIEI
jgi:hypothetical protein